MYSRVKTTRSSYKSELNQNMDIKYFTGQNCTTMWKQMNKYKWETLIGF